MIFESNIERLSKVRVRRVGSSGGSKALSFWGVMSKLAIQFPLKKKMQPRAIADQSIIELRK